MGNQEYPSDDGLSDNSSIFTISGETKDSLDAEICELMYSGEILFCLKCFQILGFGQTCICSEIHEMKTSLVHIDP